MILQQILPAILLIYRQILLAWAQEIIISEAVEHAPRHILVRLNDSLDLGPIEEACGSYRHAAGAGRQPIYTITLLVRAIMVGWIYSLSLRKLEEKLHSDLIVRWFVGWQSGETIPDHTTLGRFELWLVKNQPDLYFEKVLRQIEERYPQESQGNQIGDTYAMLANAADEGLVRRIRHTCQRLSTELGESMPNRYENQMKGYDWNGLLGVKSEKPEGLIDKVSRAQRLERTVLAALDLGKRAASMLEGYEKKQYPLVRGWCAYLDKILRDEIQVEHNMDGQVVKASELPKNKKGEFRLVSATDPEASLRVHGETAEDVQFGYNIQVAATTTGFIHATQAYTGAAPDQSGVAGLILEQKMRQEASAQEVHLPPKLIYDMAGGTGKARFEVANISQGQTQLVAKSMPYDQRSERFGPYDFSLSEDGETLTCPNGKTSTVAYRSQSADGRDFRFFACQCWGGDAPQRMKSATPEQLARRCPLWEVCRQARSGPGSMRQVFISDYRQQVLDANLYNQSPAFLEEMKQRPLIERIIFELTHYNGARHCRRRGLSAANFQARMCATAYNLKLWVRKLNRSVPALAG